MKTKTPAAIHPAQQITNYLIIPKTKKNSFYRKSTHSNVV